MANEIDPPPNDKIIERHQFYATIVGYINRNTKDINGIGNKMKSHSDDFEKVRDEVRESGTRNKTIIAAAIVIWSFIGSGVGLYITRALSSFDTLISKIDILERKMLNVDNHLETTKDDSDKIDSIRNSIKEIQRGKE